MKKHVYQISIEDNVGHQEYHPFTVTVTRNGNDSDFAGRSLPALLNKVKKHILEQEAEER